MTEDEMCKLLDKVRKYERESDIKELIAEVARTDWTPYRQFRKKLSDHFRYLYSRNET